MRGEGQSFGISRAWWVQACVRVLDPRGILSVLPQTRQAGHVSSFGLWAGGGGGVGTQGLTLCSAGPLVLSMRHQLYALQPCSWFSVRVQEPRPFPLGLVQTCGLKGGLSSTERLPEVKSFFSQTNTLLIGRCVA